MAKDYIFEIPAGGSKGVELLDYCFNQTTQTFLQRAGLREGMSVLEVGCGSGKMSCWIAQQIGAQGSLLAVDNDNNQLDAAANEAANQNLANINFKCLDVNKLEELEQQFDFIYCRFVLHHMLEPRSIVEKFYNQLKPGGIYAGEEGVVSNGFAYPYSLGFGHERFEVIDYHSDHEGKHRDGNFGIKLYHTMFQQGFKNLNVNLIAPVLQTREEKLLLRPGMLESRSGFLKEGGAEDEWHKKLNSLDETIADDSAVVAFYQSVQVFGSS